jgi:molybdopterin/thiamine biosynthesis adenylyltransferase
VLLAKKPLSVDVPQNVLDALEELKLEGHSKTSVIENAILSWKTLGRFFLYSKEDWKVTKAVVVRYEYLKSQREFARQNNASIEDLAKIDAALDVFKDLFKRLEKGGKP